MTLAFQKELEENKLCRSELLIEFPALCEQHSKQLNGSNDLQSSLVIAPNPAKETAYIHFNLGSTAATAHNSMEVYDLTGRVLQRIALTTQLGILNLDVKRYAVGQYIVVLRSNGAVVQQQNLLIQE